MLFNSFSKILQFDYNYKQMINSYPLQKIDKDDWNRKVSACSMYTIPAEDEALPILYQIEQILTRLIDLPLAETISQENQEYFLIQVFPVVCQKIIKSRYFKSQIVLRVSNHIVELTFLLVPKYLDLVDKYPTMAEILTICLQGDQYYFKSNSQLQHKRYPYQYFENTNNQFHSTLAVGDYIDVLKFTVSYDKFQWSQGTIVQANHQELEIQYLLDPDHSKIKVDREGCLIAPYKSKSEAKFAWRNQLKVGDLVDAEDSFGAWYNATVVKIIGENENTKVKVYFKVYHENGNKMDTEGRYYGFSDYPEVYELTSPRLQPYCSIAKEFSYESSKASTDYVDDFNDLEVQEINGEPIYALPRKRFLSGLFFNLLNKFGKLGGFTTLLQKLQKQKPNIILLTHYVKGLSGVVPYLHRSVLLNLIQKVKSIIEKNVFAEDQEIAKYFTKENSEMIFSGLRTLQRRIKSMESTYEYENSLKITLVNKCINSQALKRKLQGLNELKQIIKSLTYGSSRNSKIIAWIKEQNLFEKIYLTNSHVQLIKKSETFFRYYINQNILQIEDLEKLVKIAQKGDYESRISLYSLFMEVSHIFKKQHVDFLIDRILETPLDSIMNEDIDLLHELSRFSTYFPMHKVMNFFEGIILNEDNVKGINAYATKKYADIVAKSYQMKTNRKEIVQKLLEKLKTNNIAKITSILRLIFEGIGIGEWGRKQLSEILEDEDIDALMITLIKTRKEDTSKFISTVLDCLNFMQCIFKISSKFKIHVSSIKQIWLQISTDPILKKQFFKWSQQILKCQQGLSYEKQTQLEELFVLLFDPLTISTISEDEFEMFKSFFIEINKSQKLITISNIIRDKEIQKQYKRRCSMNQLKFYQIFLQILYNPNEVISSKALHLFIALYSSTDNTKQEIEGLTDYFYFQLKKNSQAFLAMKKNSQALLTMKNSQGLITSQKEQKERISILTNALSKILDILEIIIDDSEKCCEETIQSLLSKKKNNFIKLNLINQVNYFSDNVKKMEINIPINATLFQLRKHISNQLDINWQEIRLAGKKQFVDLQNGRTIKELNISSSETYTISRRALPSHTEAELVLNNEMVPKAVRAFTSIFNEYSKDGKMSKEDCMNFTAKCLGSSSPKYYADRIQSVYKQYDDDNDGYLSLPNFITFYKDSALDRASTVWSNLRSFGIQSDFRLKNQPLEAIDLTYLPRKKLSSSQQCYNILFNLIKHQQLAERAFTLLERLPVSKHVYQEILSTNTDQLDLDKILNTSDKLIFFYKLNIIQYLSQPDQTNTEHQKEWILRFISEKGYQRLFTILHTFVSQYQSTKPSQYQSPKPCHENMVKMTNSVDKEIIQNLIDLLHQFFLSCFSTPESLQCYSLLTDSSDIDDKLQYLVTGKFPKGEKVLKVQQREIVYEFTAYRKEQICEVLIKLLIKVWSEENGSYLKETLISKLIDALGFMLMNEDPTFLATNLNIFIEHNNSIQNTKELKKLYSLILCFCFYSQHSQPIFIKELFKYLTSSNIISEHFGILAILVNKFGLSEVNEEHTKNILFDNIFNSENQLTIEGCARLLCNFDVSSFNVDGFNRLWDDCLFGKHRKCNKEQTKEALYDLILKMCDNNMALTDQIIKKMKITIDECFSQMRITSCSELNQRSLNNYVGLKNLGSICYINSMMQQLFCNKAFRYLMMRVNDFKHEELIQYKGKQIDDNILHQFQKIFAYLEISTRMDYIPNDFCFAYKPFGQPVNVLMQQDVQEFISMFFDQLENRIKDTPFRNVIDSFYAGMVTNLFHCHQCSQTKKVTENFYSLTLEVKSSKTLTESLNRFISGEVINDYKCDFCDKRADVSKKTRISKCPKILILHLQRIVFNLDTFINEKITTKHSFPMNFNLHPYTLEQYQKVSASLSEEEIKSQYDYNLIGIICHIGNAESGHYISYIKITQNKWLEFNDSLINTFSINNIEEECYGGGLPASSSTNFIDDHQWDLTTQSSKSAYILLYEKKGEVKLELFLKSLQDKNIILKQYSLQELQEKITHKKKSTIKESELIDQNQLLEVEAEVGRKKSYAETKIPSGEQESDEEIIDKEGEQKVKEGEGSEKMQERQQKREEEQEIKIQINANVGEYMPQKLRQQILNDNKVHFFEKMLASPNFAMFFSKILRNENSLNGEIYPLLKKVTFGFWIKSPHFKELLKTNLNFIEKEPKYMNEIILDNENMFTLLIEYSDQEVRTRIASFIVKGIQFALQKLDLQSEDQTSIKIRTFLDKLFALLPTTVSKCWTKFTEYFEFWYEFARSGQQQLKYMLNKQVIKHFLDYYLDKKSPLQIYANKPHQIGSKYSNPNFAMLLKAVTYLLSQCLKHSQVYSLTKDDYSLLVHFDCLEKLIGQNYESQAVNLVREICFKNINASEKIAIILLKGLCKSTFNNVQPYLDILYEYILIDDEYQALRMKWVLGKQTLCLTTIHKNVTAFTSYTYQERLYNFNSTISLDNSACLLDPIFQLNKRAENFCMLSLRCALKLCEASPIIYRYIFHLDSPVLYYSKFADFFDDFINRYYEEAKRTSSYYQNGFNKEEVGKEVKALLQKIKKKYEVKAEVQLKSEDIVNRQQFQINEKSNEIALDGDDIQKGKTNEIQRQKGSSIQRQKGNEIQRQKGNEIQRQKGNEIQKVKGDKQKSNRSSKKKKKGMKNSNSSEDEWEGGIGSNYKDTYMPVKFKYIQKQTRDLNGIKITSHQSELTYLLLKPNGKTNYSLKSSSMMKNIDKITEEIWETQKIQIVKGYFIQNQTKELYRIHTNEGSLQVRSGDCIWAWVDTIVEAFPTERAVDWPKWSIFPVEAQKQQDKS